MAGRYANTAEHNYSSALYSGTKQFLTIFALGIQNHEYESIIKITTDNCTALLHNIELNNPCHTKHQSSQTQRQKSTVLLDTRLIAW